MSKLFVPYHLSHKLKNKGFTLDTYPIKDEVFGVALAWYHQEDNISDDHIFLQYRKDKEFCYAPIYQQAVDWFREVHKIHIEVYHQLRPANNIKYAFKISGTAISGDIYDGFEDYYDAFNAAIGEAIKLI